MIILQLKVWINHFFHRGFVCNMSHNCYVNDCCCSLSCVVGALVFSSGSCLGVGCEAHINLYHLSPTKLLIFSFFSFRPFTSHVGY
jgi:hypothetical protein